MLQFSITSFSYRACQVLPRHIALQPAMPVLLLVPHSVIAFTAPAALICMVGGHKTNQATFGVYDSRICTEPLAAASNNGRKGRYLAARHIFMVCTICIGFAVILSLTDSSQRHQQLGSLHSMTRK